MPSPVYITYVLEPWKHIHGNTTHNMHLTSIYRRWASMLSRCHHPSTDSYPNYGGRGIKVCKRWRTFANFYADMGEAPPGMTLDRINVNGHYTPRNCRWATHKDQAKNKRKTNK